MNKEYNNIAEGDHQKFLKQIIETKGEAAAVEFIKANMEQILVHYIGCNWGACYNTKFKELIQPYFDDTSLLDQILRSEMVRDKPNVVIGKTGAKIFKELFYELKKCQSEKIQDYLDQEFAIIESPNLNITNP